MISCMLIDLDRAVNRTLLIGTKRISTISDVQYENLHFFQISGASVDYRYSNMMYLYVVHGYTIKIYLVGCICVAKAIQSIQSTNFIL